MADHGGDGETQALDGGTPPLGSPFSNGDATQSEGGNGVMYWETQALDEAETQVVDDGLEEEEGVAGDWAETQLVEDCEEEEDDSGVAEQVKTQLVEDCEEDGCGAGEQEKTHAMAECEKKEDDGVMEDNAGDWARTQLVEGCEVEDGGNDGVGDMVETQLVRECQEVDERGECQEEDERVNGSGDEDVGEWGMTQLVEDTDEELGDDGDDDLSEGTQVLSDNEGLSNDERDVKLGMGGGNGEMNGAVHKHDNTKNLVYSDASTDEEGDTVRTCELAAARDAFTVNSVQQGKRQASTNETHLLTKIIDKSTSCSTSFGDRPVCGIDDDSHGYVQNHDKDGTKSRGRCSTAKKLFADTMAEEGENKNRCVAGLSYIESQEPGDLSQANALEVVDRLISINGGVSSQEPTPNKLETAKLPVSSKRGTLMFAEKVDRSKSSNGRAEIFAWVDSREDDGGGDFFSKNKNILLRTSAGRGRSKSQFPRAKKCSTKIAPGENKIGECKNRINSELCERFETFPLPDARLLKSDAKSKRSSGKRTKKNLLKDLDDLSDAKYLGEQQEKVSVSSHDVGPDTQMALEAIEALAQCSPAKFLSAKGEPPLEREMRDEKSKLARSHSKNGPPQKRTRGIQEGITARSKRRKVTVLNPKPQKERQRGQKMQENSKDLRANAKHKEAKSVPEKSKVSEISLDGNKYHGTPIAHCTRHSRKSNLFEYTELCSNKHLKRGMNLTGYSSTIVEVQNNNEPELRMISERTTESGLNYVEKQSTEYTCANNAQHLQQCRDENTQHTSADIAQNLEPCRGEPTTDVACREPSSHPKQRRTPTAMVQSRAPTVTQTATDHEITPEVARQTKKRRVFIRSASDLLKYAKREPSNGRSTSMLSSIIAKSAASPIPNSSVRVDSKTSGFSSPGQRQKEPSNVDDASNSPKSNSQVQNSALKTPSKVVNELSPAFSPLNPSKASSRSLSKSSVARELLKLDHQNALSNRRLKDSRRRKDVTSSSILFSHHLDEDVIKCQKKILARLGVCEVFAMSDATHFVADSFFRTKNMLEAIALGKLVVTSMWLENCGPAGCFIDEKKYILRDAKKEKEIGFSMPISLASACKHPLLLGKRVFVTLNVKPSREVVTSLVLASSGQPLERIGRSIMKGKEVPDDLLIISCEEDSETVEPLLERGASVFNSELVLNGIIIQKLEYERHRLFSDRVRQTRSTRWLKDAAHGRFVPVSKCS